MPRPATSPVRSATNLLHAVLFLKAYILAVGVCFIAVALLGSEEILQHYFPCLGLALAADCPGETRRVLLRLGVTLSVTSAIAGLANCLALLGLRLGQHLLLLPYLASLYCGISISLFNILEAIYSNRGIEVSSNGSVTTEHRPSGARADGLSGDPSGLLGGAGWPDARLPGALPSPARRARRGRSCGRAP
jgi:hypothetical protein